MSPLAFMQGMHAAHARLDAYAQNPYPVSSRRDSDPCSRARRCGYFTMAMLPTIRADVDALFRYQAALADRVRLSDESARPAARRLVCTAGRISERGRAARLAAERRDGADPLSHSRRAQPRGLAERSLHRGRDGEARLSRLRAAARPGVEARSRRHAMGPGATRRRAPRLHRSARGRQCVACGRRRRPHRLGGTFTRTVALPRGTRVRLWAPSIGWASPALALS